MPKTEEGNIKCSPPSLIPKPWILWLQVLHPVFHHKYSVQGFLPGDNVTVAC
jgi:hypothetical protein